MEPGSSVSTVTSVLDWRPRNRD